jgi:hypothetical protein
MSIPNTYTAITNAATEGRLTPLQIAAANYILTGATPLGINPSLLTEMTRFCNSNVVSTTVIGIKPNVASNTVFQVSGNVVSINRVAANCGPEENRRETVFVSNLNQIPGAVGTFLYYGPPVFPGPYAQGSSGPMREADWEGGVWTDAQGYPITTADGRPITYGSITEYGTAIAFMNAIQNAADMGSTTGSAATTENSPT